VASNIWRALPRPVQWFSKLFMLSNEEGARTPLYCATAPELSSSSGRYYNHSREARTSPLAARCGAGAGAVDETEAITES